MVGIGVWNWQNLRILRHFSTPFLTLYTPKMAKIAKKKWYFWVLSNFLYFSLATICFWPYMRYQWRVWVIYTLLSKKLSIFNFLPHPPMMTQISDSAFFCAGLYNTLLTSPRPYLYHFFTLLMPKFPQNHCFSPLVHSALGAVFCNNATFSKTLYFVFWLKFNGLRTQYSKNRLILRNFAPILSHTIYHKSRKILYLYTR